MSVLTIMRPSRRLKTPSKDITLLLSSRVKLGKKILRSYLLGRQMYLEVDYYLRSKDTYDLKSNSLFLLLIFRIKIQKASRSTVVVVRHFHKKGFEPDNSDVFSHNYHENKTRPRQRRKKTRKRLRSWLKMRFRLQNRVSELLRPVRKCYRAPPSMQLPQYVIIACNPLLGLINRSLFNTE